MNFLRPAVKLSFRRESPSPPPNWAVLKRLNTPPQHMPCQDRSDLSARSLTVIPVRMFEQTLNLPEGVQAEKLVAVYVTVLEITAPM